MNLFRTTLLSLTAMTLFNSAVAEAKLTCSFTEPFIFIEFDPKTKMISKITPESYDSNGIVKPEILSKRGELVYVKPRKVDSSIGVYASEYELRDGDKKILSLILNMKGSDGMSSFIFPYDARMPHQAGVDGQLWGGCESTELVKVCPPDGGC